MFLITSGAYIGSELEAEFGLLPPSFLPVGNQRLFKHQIESIRALTPDQDIVLSLPQSFSPRSMDCAYLSDHDVELVFVPDGLSLGQSIVYALNMLDKRVNDTLYLIHGDTLIQDLWLKPDMIGVSHTFENYHWASYDERTGILFDAERRDMVDPGLVANGFFSFSKPYRLIKNIIEAQWHFIDGINNYHKETPLSCHHTQEWLDFGHSHTYYRSKSAITTQRAFNQLAINDLFVEKSSDNTIKIQAEANWYKKLPQALKVYSPQFLGENDAAGRFSYQIEYLHLTALNELYVFGDLPAIVWRVILDSCFKFVQIASDYVNPDDRIIVKSGIWENKTSARLKQLKSNAAFIQQIDFDNPLIFNGSEMPSINKIKDHCTSIIPQHTQPACFYHGDFCFSNILYDFRSGAIKAIDPRGIDETNMINPYGSWHYDIAKLAHSIVGLYDFIIAGYFELTFHKQNDLTFKIFRTPFQKEAISHFYQRANSDFGLSKREVLAMQIHLFLSMLPLHSENSRRQFAFVANVYRLYEELVQ